MEKLKVLILWLAIACLIPAIAFAAFPNSLTNAVDGVTTVSASIVNNLESKVGVNNSTDHTSLDYKINTLLNSLIGVLIPYGGTTPPTGFLLCDGSAVSRTTYANLFAITGTAFGVGNGSTTFNLPDMRGKFPLGKAVSGTGSTLGGTGGTIDHTHTFAESQTANVTTSTVNAIGGDPLGTWVTGVSLSAGNGGPTGTANPPFTSVNYIIKY